MAKEYSIRKHPDVFFFFAGTAPNLGSFGVSLPFGMSRKDIRLKPHHDFEGKDFPFGKTLSRLKPYKRRGEIFRKAWEAFPYKRGNLSEELAPLERLKPLLTFFF